MGRTAPARATLGAKAEWCGCRLESRVTGRGRSVATRRYAGATAALACAGLGADGARDRALWRRRRRQDADRANALHSVRGRRLMARSAGAALQLASAFLRRR